MTSLRHVLSTFSAVIVRLVRNCALERTIQYPRGSDAILRSRGVLDSPPARGM